MTTWRDFAAECPELAAAVRARFEVTKHHVLATLRGDGSPRVSGTEVSFSGDRLTIGSMRPAVKADDLLRDGRYALHSNPGDGSLDGGDAKISGVATEVASGHGGEPADPGSYTFALDVGEVVHVSLDDERQHLVVRSWRPGRGERRVLR
jgi:hypothetical protein